MGENGLKMFENVLDLIVTYMGIMVSHYMDGRIVFVQIRQKNKIRTIQVLSIGDRVLIESLTLDCVYGGKGFEEKFNCFAICQAF